MRTHCLEIPEHKSAVYLQTFLRFPGRQFSHAMNIKLAVDARQAYLSPTNGQLATLSFRGIDRTDDSPTHAICPPCSIDASRLLRNDICSLHHAARDA